MAKLRRDDRPWLATPDEPKNYRGLAEAFNREGIKAPDGEPWTAEKYEAWDREHYRAFYKMRPELVRELLEDPDKLDALKRDPEACKKWLHKLSEYEFERESVSWEERMREQFLYHVLDCVPGEYERYMKMWREDRLEAHREHLRVCLSDPQKCQREVNEVWFPFSYGKTPR
jgi:hypothetical protein